jgi:hypothetical protein
MKFSILLVAILLLGAARLFALQQSIANASRIQDTEISSSRVEGKRVTTIESLSSDLSHPVQRASVVVEKPSLVNVHSPPAFRIRAERT